MFLTQPGLASMLHKGRQTLPSFPAGPRKAAGAQGKRSDWGLRLPPWSYRNCHFNFHHGSLPAPLSSCNPLVQWK